MKLIDLTNKQFKRLKVINMHHKDKYNVYWLCKCDCGKECVVSSNNLSNGSTKSCGCLRADTMRDLSQKNIIHGDTGKRFYKIWSSIRQRCLNKNNPTYKYYGYRGIKICDSWLESYSNFKKDMYESYEKHIKEFGEKETTIERIDVDGNYCKENCKWETIYNQNLNKRNTIYLEYDGKIKTLKDWSKELSICYDTLFYRVKIGWSNKKIIETKV